MATSMARAAITTKPETMLAWQATGMVRLLRPCDCS